jgi:hypothetical protein
MKASKDIVRGKIFGFVLEELIPDESNFKCFNNDFDCKFNKDIMSHFLTLIVNDSVPIFV